MSATMRLAIIGDGKMGRAIAALAAERGDTVTALVGLAENRGGAGITRERLGDPEVAVEFTEPDAAVANALACLRVGVPVVVGTTGWYDSLERVTRAAAEARGALFWSPNFSLGIAVLTAAIEAAARAVRALEGFDAQLIETHHAAKKDRPSGTAAALAGRMEAMLGRPVPVTSVRTGHVPGTHEIVFDGMFEQVRLVHEARDRRVFAAGALSAAAWLRGRAGVFTMRDVVQAVGAGATTEETDR
ncbi:MAG TPA: dihydrodipicolinate reductase C-terminal domain-containing protein [Gemmatimonadaceae bacterium]|nr:dihydrodipicolinate reductase C-terminal domain-containing protein [Gemmatimonadaceae bacterium]